MFERFTDSSRRLLVLAQEEVAELHHTVIGNVHLLLALMREGDAGASKLLGELGITLERAREVVAQIHETAEARPQGHVPFTREAKRALELALRAALRRGHNFIGTAHVLEGILEVEDETIETFVDQLGLDLDSVREIAAEAAGAYGEQVFAVGRFMKAMNVLPHTALRSSVVGAVSRSMAPDEQLKSVLEQLARANDARVEEARARAAAETLVESLRRRLDEAHAQIEELRRRASGE